MLGIVVIVVRVVQCSLPTLIDALAWKGRLAELLVDAIVRLAHPQRKVALRAEARRVLLHDVGKVIGTHTARKDSRE